MFLKFALLLSNRIGRLDKIPNEIRAKESVVSLATPHSAEAKAIIDNCMEKPIYKKILSDYLLSTEFLIENYCIY